jgi:histidine triad (HIT) family protein
MTCLFCRVISGELPSSRVFEDVATLAIMDLRQTNAGHVLVLPKQHVETLDDLPDELAGPLMRTTALVTGALRRALKPDGVNVWQSNGHAAGQEVLHVHMLVFPRYVADGHFRIYPGRAPNAPRAQLDELAERLRAALPAG